jgi:hypothetical protein
MPRQYKRIEHQIIDGVERKYCKHCDEWLSLDMFSKASKEWDGLQYKCKGCHGKYEKVNKERISECRNKPENKKRKNARMREYYQENKEEINRKNKKYYEENKEQLLKTCKEYVQHNREKINKKRMERYHNDPEFKMTHLMRTRINDLLTRIGASKESTTINLVGCTIETLKEHLESQFKEGMTWENHGVKGWHIDHATPCASFDLSDPDQQKECFHYTNLQPLWWWENLEKGSRL